MAAANDDAKPIPPAPLRIGPFNVRVTRAEVEAFGREISASVNDGDVPFTFPIRWFAHPDIRAAGERLGGTEPWVPIHESQSFDYERPLAIDVDYSMIVEMTRELEPSRLVLRAEIGDGAPCLRSEMILRIIPTSLLEQG